MKYHDNSNYQDKKYGEKKRVHNQKKDGTWKCTVCLKVKTDK